MYLNNHYKSFRKAKVQSSSFSMDNESQQVEEFLNVAQWSLEMASQTNVSASMFSVAEIGFCRRVPAFPHTPTENQELYAHA